MVIDFAQPDFAGPDFAGPDFAGPDFAGPDFAGPDFAGPDFAGPDFSLPDFVLPAEREAHDPPEARGLARDGVRTAAGPARSAITPSGTCPACCSPATCS